MGRMAWYVYYPQGVVEQTLSDGSVVYDRSRSDDAPIVCICEYPRSFHFVWKKVPEPESSLAVTAVNESPGFERMSIEAMYRNDAMVPSMILHILNQG
jgi:hypothetical protein